MKKNIAAVLLGLWVATSLFAQSQPSRLTVVSSPPDPKPSVVFGDDPMPSSKPPQPPAPPVQVPAEDGDSFEPPMTVQEWNRMAVKMAPNASMPKPRSGGQAPAPTDEEKRGMYSETRGVVTVMDDTASSRVYPITTLIYHCTLIQLPSTALRVWCGDLQAWSVDTDGAFINIKPLAPNLSTNIHAVTTDNRMYNFRLISVANGDYTDYINVMSSKAYQADTSQILQQKVTEAKTKLEAEYAKKESEKKDETSFQAARSYSKQTFTDYVVKQASTFTVSGVFNDSAFTYFTVSGDEKPTVYLETKRGFWHRNTRELLNFNVTAGNFYRVQKLLAKNQALTLVVRTDKAEINRKGKT